MKKKTYRVLLMFAALALFVVPIAAIAAGGFTDVDDANIFKADIQWMADNAITKGCNPPANDKFCPQNTVTREQMSAFMRRLATGKVVDAKTAIDSDTLDGKDSTDFLGKTETAADSAKVGGYAATSLIRATGTTITIALGAAVGSGATSSFGSVTINAPVAGALVINGSLNLFCQGGIFGTCTQSSGNTYINIDGTQYSRQYYAIDGTASATNSAAWNSSNTAYVPVAAGDHIVKLDVVNSGAGATWVWSGGINVTFVPFGGDGATPAGEVSAALSGADAKQN